MTTPMGESHASRRQRRTRWIAVVAAFSLNACNVDPDLPDGPPTIVDPANPACPEIAPLSGPYAMKGDCCYRASNKLKLDRSDGGTADVEFRMMASQVVTQPRTIGSTAFLDYVQRGYDLNRSVSLIRIREFPGNEAGDVVIETGPGRFNADGTYSFLKDAAPENELSDDISRWNSVTAPAHYDPAAPENERFKPLDPNALNGLVLSPEWQPGGDLDYELPQFSPRVLSMTLDDDFNCVGERGDETRWVSRNEIASFVPIDVASRSQLSSGWSLCTSLAFGFIASGGGSCEQTPRALWIEKPTGMCVDSICYVGDARDSEADCRGATEDEDERPLCCDPVGNDPVLPACNAFHVRARYVAAAVEITDAPVNDGAPLLPTR